MGSVLTPRLRRGAATLIGGTIGAAAIGFLAGRDPKIGICCALAVVVLAIIAVDPLLLAVLVLPGAFILQRVGGASSSLSVADLLVFIGTLAALPQIRLAASTNARRFLLVVIAYQTILLVVLVAHPNRYDIVEWFHRLFDLIGATAVGVALVSSGRMQQALRLYLVGAAVIAVLAIEHAFTLHFAPAQWGLYQKNYIGEMMWLTIALIQLRPSWMGLEGRFPLIVKWLCVGGLLSSQSRQSIVALIAALAVGFVLRPEIRRRSKAAILGGIGSVALLYYSISSQLKHEFKFSSIEIRLVQLRSAINIWHHALITGQGLGFYFLHQFVWVSTPPNIVVDALASSGLVGLLALVVLLLGTLGGLAALPRQYGVVGFAILAAHFLQGMFDVFWIGASLIVPLVIAGMCLGAADRADGLEPMRVATPFVVLPQT